MTKHTDTIRNYTTASVADLRAALAFVIELEDTLGRPDTRTEDLLARELKLRSRAHVLRPTADDVA